MYCYKCGEDHAPGAACSAPGGSGLSGKAARTVKHTEVPVKLIAAIVAVLVGIIAMLAAIIVVFTMRQPVKTKEESSTYGAHTEAFVTQAPGFVPETAPATTAPQYEKKPLTVTSEDETFIRTVLSAIGTDSEFYNADSIPDSTVAFSVLGMPDIPYNCYGTKDYVPYSYNDNYEMVISAKDFDEACLAIFGRTLSAGEMRFIETYAGYKVLSDGYQRLANNGRGGYSEVEIDEIITDADEIRVRYKRHAYKSPEASANRTPTESVSLEAVFVESGSAKYPFRIISLKKTGAEKYEKTGDELTVEKARQMYLKTCEVYNKWFVFPEVDESDSFNTEIYTYRRVTDELDTKAEIMAELNKYIDYVSCETLFNEAYVERNGKLYHAVPIFGFETSFSIVDEHIEKQGDKWKYTLDLMCHELGDTYPHPPVEFTLKYENGNLVFENFYIFECQYSCAWD